MQKSLLIIAILTVAGGASAQYEPRYPILAACPTLSRIAQNGQLQQLSNPIFTEQLEARKFAKLCKSVADELASVGDLPPEYQRLQQDASLAAEFLVGDTYLLATCRTPSVITLRESVKIHPPQGFVYVRTYSSLSAMSPLLATTFQNLAPSEGTQVKGITIKGRYIALLDDGYEAELKDNLAHEMVHAYLSLASPAPLPRWFQEGAAVYLSTGGEKEFYRKRGDSRIRVVTVPEDYQRKLHSFQYIERSVGKHKLYQFIRESVATGKPDARPILGLGPKVEQRQRPVWPIFAVGGGLLFIVLVVGIVQYRRDIGRY